MMSRGTGLPRKVVHHALHDRWQQDSGTTCAQALVSVPVCRGAQPACLAANCQGLSCPVSCHQLSTLVTACTVRLCRQAGTPKKDEYTPSLSPLSALTWLIISDPVNVVPAVYPRLCELTWRRKVLGSCCDFVMISTVSADMKSRHERRSNNLRCPLEEVTSRVRLCSGAYGIQCEEADMLCAVRCLLMSVLLPQDELDCTKLAAVLAAHPRLTQLDLGRLPWLAGHLPSLRPLSGVYHLLRGDTLHTYALHKIPLVARTNSCHITGPFARLEAPVLFIR